MLNLLRTFEAVADWMLKHCVGILLALAILIIIAFTYLAGEFHVAQRAEFMAECLQYERQYDCLAKWREGN